MTNTVSKDYEMEFLLEKVLSEKVYLTGVDFDGFPGGYSFHQDGELVFNQFFGTKNPFAGMIIEKKLVYSPYLKISLLVKWI